MVQVPQWSFLWANVVEAGKCPECGTAIGGEGHRLLSNNAYAGEIDNSLHSAYLRNFIH